MPFARTFARGLRTLFGRDAADRDVSEEVRQYFEDAVAERIAHGATPEEARRAAREELGNATLVREQVRSYGWENVVEDTWADVRFAARQLRKQPGFAVTAILVLALGIGATTAIFSAVNPILFETLPYPQAKQLMMVWEGKGGGGRMVNFATFRGISEQSRSFAALAAMKPWQPTLTGPTQPERFEGQRVSADYFRVLGIAPALGRVFQAADDLYHGPNVVILSHRVWQQRFRSDPAIVGQAITLDDNPFTVIGVMPAGFEDVLAAQAQVWAPLQYDPALNPMSREFGHHLRMVARLRAGVTRGAAAAELETIRPRLAQMYAKGYDTAGGPPEGFVVDSLQADITQDVRPALLAVLAAVLLVLLIACVNVTNLLLARGAQRRGELAMRVALGAARGRLLRQLTTESLLVSLLGGALGIAIAFYGVRALVALAPPELPRLTAIRVDAPVFLFALAIATVVGLVIGIIPALHVSRDNLQSGVQQTARGAAATHQTTRRALVIAEVALALMLLVSAGLLLRSLQRLFSADPGFDASHVLTMEVDEASHRYDKKPARLEFFRQALEAARAVPGVESAAFTSQLPLSGQSDVYGIYFEKDGPSSYKDEQPALRYAVTPGYFETMDIPVRRGRVFNERDTATSPRVAIINESLARREFGASDPIGQRICLRCNDAGPDRPWSVIVGVVADVKQSSLAIGEEDAFYLPSAQWYWADNTMSLVARTRGGPATLAPAMKSAVWKIDKDVPVVKVATMDALLQLSEARRRFALTVFAVFALVGLVLAATGLYGVLSGGVTERLREIGVRAALGASRSDILALIVRQGMRLTVIGLILGLAGAAITTRLLITLLFGISRLDPLTYGGVIALLLAVSLVACGLPAWRAARVDPSITLRAE
ncbi:MAG TPA: ABC transporter permease [Terriglobales bacterium]|nr:ABC transporter permease [Terriglobales bacterium]